ncbi:hypothetical protein OBV68_001626 [Escherichia coli]|uniref:hypothetical protein n=1 Tax=Escherichia coli TaxID=562 RepID=UPI0002512789|nr:hypothetical protein [Escherichia coli]EIQ67994.1 hypothetical protein ECEPECC34262_4362 [Escherichia coli EPEC C342-62]EEW2737560.1 hypothetical protein [Escherichia coli]EFF4930716.1 hypothetical protein [Escherichia coli]EFI1605005.1 hypothetical protein [Escherichia coli]EHW87363.1 hypothetical protein ECDEC11A_3973 [Escherichia coli DEC11A]
MSGIAFLNEIDANSIGKVSIHHANFFDYFLKKAKYYCPDAIINPLLILDNQHG